MPTPPYYAVIFSSLRTAADEDGYRQMAAEMQELAAQQPGFLGYESAREDGRGITVSYWRDMSSIRRWKSHARHLQAQKLGREKWYAEYHIRIARVSREYGATNA